jgi:hypothetical protein
VPPLMPLLVRGCAFKQRFATGAEFDVQFVPQMHNRHMCTAQESGKGASQARAVRSRREYKDRNRSICLVERHKPNENPVQHVELITLMRRQYADYIIGSLGLTLSEQFFQKKFVAAVHIVEGEGLGMTRSRPQPGSTDA